MIILHAGFWESSLLLWGEVPAGGTTSRAKRRRPKAETPPADPLPYGAGKGALLEALRETGYEYKPHHKDLKESVAWLPTLNGRPLASSPLVSEESQPSEAANLHPWAVTALPLDTECSLSLLIACLNKSVLKPGVIIGSDLAYWAIAMRFAGALVARQQFLPGIEKANGSYRACWKPVITGPDAERSRKLAEAMPAAARALTSALGPPPETPRRAVLSRFVDNVVDYLVRFSGYSVPPSRLSEGMRSARPPGLESIHDQWLAALRSWNPALEGDEGTLEQFATQVREWQRPVLAPTRSPFRLCLRLEEPREEDGESPKAQEGQGNWYVRYLLQAADDPSLQIPVKEAWSARGSESALLKQGGFKTREYVLLSLGQASGLCPRIEASLRAARPEGYELDATGAYEFLTEKAMALEQSGFGVLLPAWWTRQGTKVRLSARLHVKSPTLQGGGGLSLEDLMDFQWQVALGNEQLSFEELQTLAKLKAPLVKVRGQWVQLSAEEIQAALDFWKSKAAHAMTAREVLKTAMGAVPMPVNCDEVTATGWMGDLLAQLSGRATLEPLPTPEGFEGVLRPYQVRVLSWLAFLRRWGLGACLADDMGLGKTIQTLALLEREARSNGQHPVLLICPMSVVGNWHKEAERFTPRLRVMVHHGASRAKGESFKEEAEKFDLVISSYALLQRDLGILEEVPWAGVVLDEAQNIKNPETKQSRAARTLKADYRIALTGTPVENNVGDLWSIMEFLNPGLLGSQAEFKKTFFIPIQAQRDPAAVKRLHQLTGPFILRRLKTDKAIITDLPEKMEMKVFCTLTKEQGSLYAAVVEEATQALESAEGIKRKGVVLATLSKLKQVCNHPAQFLGDNSPLPDRSGKLARLVEMVEEMLAAGDRALIFTQFAEMGEILKRHLQETFGQETLFLHGGVPQKQRDVMVDRFQNHPEAPNLFILSLKAGGTGLNLTRANHVFHFDRWWNPAVENQATDRAFRIGQSRRVQVHKFLCVGTLEEKIDEMIERKKEIAAGVVGAGEGWLTELSTAELKEIFALRKEALEA